MDFSLPPEVERYRDDVRRIVAETVTPEVVDRMHTTGTFNAPELNRALGAAGFLERAVPGLGKGDPIELYVLFSELEKAGAPYDGAAIALMIAGVVQAVGTEEQRERILPSITSGEALVCMGYSEPDNGSDLAGIKTRAVRDGDEWVINGAKMWTTMAHEAKWLILLTRTDPDLPPRRGLTMFILPMDTPGITVDPVHTMATERTNAPTTTRSGSVTRPCWVT
jgi:alkylation response protein AidB-like acyl-CoA dehydrogenase